jgi:riboflavin synthase
MVLAAPSFHQQLQVKDSVAVNGVCLTVTGLTGRDCAFTVSTATLETSNLGRLQAGHRVNLELPLTPDSPMGGHYVLGHVDTVGTLTSLQIDGQAWRLDVSVPDDFEKYLVPRGSIAVDGVSLTIASIRKNEFTAVILPLTLESTILQYGKPGDPVNLEGDILAKYIYKYLAAYQADKGSEGGISEALLKKHGFL